MSLPPERISIKRRRQDEPVETLYLEHGTGPENKRRLTNFYFRRLRHDAITPASLKFTTSADAKDTSTSKPSAVQNAIPSVRATQPGEEFKDLATRKAAQKSQEKTETEKRDDMGEKSQPTPSTAASSHHSPQLRRFHLTRHLSSVLSPDRSGGIRRHKSYIRPPLATFVERQTATFEHERHAIHTQPPVDKLLKLVEPEGGDRISPTAPHVSKAQDVELSKRITTNTFVKPTRPPQKKGQSIRDHPSTWDHDSDQLADELAALAMELDPDIRPQPAEHEHTDRLSQPTEVPRILPVDFDNEFVYETYVRVRHNDEAQNPRISAKSDANIGVLVIEEEDEELWQKYIESDEEGDWDDEDDSNAEDNPANDYPEDEVSSDDEYGYNPYKYRHGSDDEEYDDDGE